MSVEISEQVQWFFPGGGAGLAFAAAGLALLSALSYWRTLKDDVPGGAKVFLWALRTLFFALILLCACGPSRVVKKTEKKSEKPQVALILDESGSMRENGYGKGSRLDEAARAASRIKSANAEKFDARIFGFAKNFREARTLEELRSGGPEKEDTALFKNVAEWTSYLNAENIKAAVCISDGVDTAGGVEEEAVAALRSSPFPQFFMPATLKLPSQPSLSLARLESPSEARPGDKVPVTVVVRKTGQIPDGKIIFTAREGEREVHREEIPAKGAGSSHHAVRFMVSAQGEGLHVFEAEAKVRGLRAAKASWSLSATSAVEQSILLFQGRLTFDQAYMRRVFTGDKRARLDVRFASDVLGSGNPANPKLGSGFPGQTELAGYNLVILNAVQKSQVSRKMESDLRRYLENGGALLFMVVNNQAADEFASGDLEKMLPVTFENTSRGGGLDEETLGFVRRMSEYRKGAMRRGARGELTAPPLHKFAMTEDGRRSRIFAAAGQKEDGADVITPMFQDFALAGSAKPGAILLATASSFKKDDEGRPLLAVQNYGRGRSAALCSDGLWRWKLSLPSTDCSYETFWQNLLLWLSAGGSAKPSWELASNIFPADKPAVLRLRIPSASREKAGNLRFEAERIPGGEKTSFEMRRDGEGSLRGELRGQSDSVHRVRAVGGEGVVAETIVNFMRAETKSEMTSLSPDTRTLSTLARAAGHALLTDERGVDWDKILPPPETATVSETRTPLWHGWHVFCLAAGLLLCEFIARRFFRLV